MNKCTQNRLILGTLALVLGGNPRLDAQQSKTPSPSATASQQEPFIGLVVKSGETFVLRHASGKICDVDHPEELKHYEAAGSA